MATTEEPSGKTPRDRSPSFPFISLKAAIVRLVEFEAKFGRQEPTADRVYLAWGMAGNTSQAQQTLAALKAFGLVQYKGLGPKRPVTISEVGRKFLRAQQESVKKEVLKQFALKPKWIAYFWGKWAADKVPDEIRLGSLVLDHKFNENTAPNFLKVYDDTIVYAGLTSSDKLELPEGDILSEDEDGDLLNNGDDPPPPPPPGSKKEIKIMDGERIVFTEEGQPSQYLKLIASGDVDDFLLEALEDFVKRQRKRINAQSGSNSEPSQSKPS